MVKLTRRWEITAFVAGMPLLAFWKIFFGYGDYSFFTSNDAAQHWYPWYQYLARWVHAGTLPLWDLNLQSGRPLLGEMRPGVLYPLNLLFVGIFSTKNGISLPSMDLLVISEILLASVFQYRLARHFALSRYASLLSAVIYGYSGYVVENATWQIAILHAVIWMPLLVLLFIRAFEAKLRIRLCLYLTSGGAVFGLMVLAGHIQPPVHAMLCLGVLALFLPLTAAPDVSRRIGLIRSAFCLGTCLLLGALIALPQLLISWQYGKHSLRWLGWDNIAPVGGVNRIPYAWGGHFERGHLQDVFTAVNPGTWAGSDYFGPVTILLSAVAFLLVRREGARFFKILLVFGILLWLGEISVFHGLLYQLLPMMDKVRQPSRAIFLIHFAAAGLCGFGADALGCRIKSRYKKAHYQLARILVWACSLATALVCAAGVLAVLFNVASMTDERLEWTLRAAFLTLAAATILYFRQIGRLRLVSFRLLLIFLLCFDLFSVFSYSLLSRYGYNGKNDFFPGVHYARNSVVDFLTEKAKDSLFRVEVVGDALPLNSGMVHGFQEMTGGMATGLEAYHRFRAIDTSPNSAVSHLLNRRYIVSRSPLPDFKEVVHGSPGIYEDSLGLDRATWIPRALALENLDSVAGAIRDPAFDPRKLVLLTADQSASIPGELLVSEHAAAGAVESARIEIRSYAPNRIVLLSDAPRKGILLLSEVAYPGWKAFVDGEERPILKADFLFRAVVIGEGKHSVTFVYAPTLFYAGLGLSTVLFSLPVILVIIVAWSKRTWAPNGPGKPHRPKE